ncbi:MAG TPA: 16S rRNA (cytidine(1402)-2'-O)-methyltransferase [Acidobacteriota bacterium]|nr:16S rRNA (cytidine(1402)-2'-O)-methyltransferase [Acidobacteriota bacterium]
MRSLSEPQRAVSLFVIPTPIGNLGDLSSRAIETLNNVDYVLAEDTRRGQKLKARFGFKSKLVSFHEHNERSRVNKILALMQQGKTFALISDAGAPLVSDPGFLLIQRMIEQNLHFTSIPGPSAVINALLLSGFPTQPFTFVGFLPTRHAPRKKTLQELAALQNHTLVLFESPERIHGLLREIASTLGNRNIALCREMTKLHEEVIRGTASQLSEQLANKKWIGECTVVIAPGKEEAVEISDETIMIRFQQLIEEGLSSKDAIKKLVRETGRSRNEIYRLVHK